MQNVEIAIQNERRSFPFIINYTVIYWTGTTPQEVLRKTSHPYHQWTPSKSKAVPSGGSSFGPFIWVHLLQSHRAIRAENCKLKLI